MWPQFKCSFGFNKSTPSLWGVSKSKPLAPAHHLLYATAPPKPSIIFVLRHCASPPDARCRVSHSVSFLLASGCSSSHFAFSLFLARLRLLVVTACPLSLFFVVFVCHYVSPPVLVVAFDYATSGLLLGRSTSPRTSVASLPLGAHPIARPFSSPALPSHIFCFRPIIPPNPITANETYASVSQPLPARYACGETPLGQHNPITINATNASASQPIPALLSMMDSSQPIPRTSPKSRAKIPIVRGRGGRKGGRGGRGVSRTMHQ
ncbi:hypothetical protein Syun_027396 [Stephania yunnanensis]|uniref:Uncharacterized protein n=1 Tax=Stephania yunnanensis TaxID=152371 RepID=A0AAP0EFJ5_9MAGN